MLMKERFLNAVISGELGKPDEYGIIVKISEFKKYFSDIKTLYINSFLPAAVIETGQYNITHTKYIFRIKKGTYRVHPDAIEEQVNFNKQKLNIIKEPISSYAAGMGLKPAFVLSNQRHAIF